jgi:transcriptional regulator with XRE-family HTH domain
MRFHTLQRRLLEYLREVVQNGDATERSLARRTGMSQPHMHNILKGIRSMNSDIADLVLERLGITVYDLPERAELEEAVARRAAAEEPRVDIAVLVDRLGPGLPWPSEISLFEQFSAPCRLAAGAYRPVVARLSHDSRMAGCFAGGNLVLLDAAEGPRREPDATSLWAIDRAGEAVVRWLRRGRSGLYLAAADCIDSPHRWEYVQIPAGEIPRLVRARATILSGSTSSLVPRLSPDRSGGRLRLRDAS